MRSVLRAARERAGSARRRERRRRWLTARPSAPNIQDVFLNYARREKLTVTIHLLDGRQFEGRIKNFDRFAVVVEHDGAWTTWSSSTRSPTHPRAAQRPQLLLVAPSLTIGVSFPRAPSSSCSTASASASCPTPPPTATPGSNTLGNIARSVPLRMPTLARARPRPRSCRIGRGRRAAAPAAPAAAWPKRSAGKDSVTGHWEMMGVVLERPFPTFPHGFPPDADRRVRARASAGRCSATSSPRAPRSSTSSAPSTCAPAGRSSTPPPTASSRSPRTKRSSRSPSSTGGARSPTSWSVEGLGVGRVIARPFVGEPGAFTRTANRHDYACRRRARRCSIACTGAGVPVDGGGQDQRPVRRPGHHRGASPPASDDDGDERSVCAALRCRHAAAASSPTWSTSTRSTATATTRRATLPTSNASTRGWRDLLPRLQPDDLLVITADHGNDPTTPSTDHSREYVPVLASPARSVAGRVDLGTRATFADLGQTLADDLRRRAAARTAPAFSTG